MLRHAIRRVALAESTTCRRTAEPKVREAISDARIPAGDKRGLKAIGGGANIGSAEIAVQVEAAAVLLE